MLSTGSNGKKLHFLQLALACALLLLLVAGQLTVAQRGGGDGDDDDDDSGFDDSGYNQSPSHDAEGSHQNQNYSPSSDSEDLDDDDDVDETHVSPQVASDEADEQNDYPAPMRQQAAHMRPAPGADAGYYSNVAPQRFYSPTNSILLANVDPANNPNSYNQGQQQFRYRRSAKVRESDGERREGTRTTDEEGDVEEAVGSPSEQLVRRKRSYGSKYIGPVYTYVKTDKHAHYKWGVKHKVGKFHG